VRLAQRLGIDVVVIDHHSIQEQAETTAVWSDAFCGAGLAAMFAWALALKAGWNDAKVERLLTRCSPYAAMASIADCVPLRRSTRTLARLGLAELSRSRHKGVQELLKSSCTGSNSTGFARRGLRRRPADQRRRQNGPSG
jgi:single-stranded-DNA-specific exonuclease